MKNQLLAVCLALVAASTSAQASQKSQTSEVTKHGAESVVSVDAERALTYEEQVAINHQKKLEREAREAARVRRFSGLRALDGFNK